MSEQCSPPQRTKTATSGVKPSTIKRSTALSRSSGVNLTRLVSTTASRMAINRTPSNFFMDTMEKIQLRTPTLRIDSKTLCYEKLKFTSSQQHFRDDWGGVTAIRYLADGERVAVGFNSGDLIVSSQGTSPLRSVEPIVKGWEGNDYISCIRFHPKKPNVLYASSTAGTVMRRDLEDATNYNDFFIMETDNEIYSMAFTAGGELVTVGRDAILRMYDVEKEKMICDFGRERYMSDISDSFDSLDDFYHTKRTYCVCCHPTEPTVMVSGGWDGVRIWDSRVSTMAVRSILGPFIFGDTVDICNNLVLTASCEAQNTLQLWDLGSGFLINDLDPPNKRIYLYGEYPYAAKFFKGDPAGDMIMYGVGGLQLISVKESTILYLFEDEKPVVAVDSTDKKLAFGGKSGVVVQGKIVFPENEVVSVASYTSHAESSRSDDTTGVVDSKKEGSDMKLNESVKSLEKVSEK